MWPVLVFGGTSSAKFVSRFITIGLYKKAGPHPVHRHPHLLYFLEVIVVHDFIEGDVLGTGKESPAMDTLEQWAMSRQQETKIPNSRSEQGYYGCRWRQRGFSVLRSTDVLLTPHSQEWSFSNFPCSLSRNITSHSVENLAFQSFLRWKVVVLPPLTTSLIHLNLRVKGLSGRSVQYLKIWSIHWIVLCRRTSKGDSFFFSLAAFLSCCTKLIEYYNK